MTAKTMGPATETATPSFEGVSRRRIKLEAIGPGLQETFAAAKAKRAELGYKAADPSKFRSQRTGLGGTADTHYQYGTEYWRIREWVRAFERDNALIAQIVSRGLDQVLGNGLQVDPQTGDADLNEKIGKLWDAWADDPEQCDYSGRFTFDQIERLALRHRWIDGDAFAVLDAFTGSIALHEGDRVTSAGTAGLIQVNGRQVDVVHGVELDPDTGRVLAYHFLRRIDRRTRGYRTVAVGSPDLVRLPADQVLHIFEPLRVTQHRGITAFHAVFDRIALLEDIEFAELIKLQVASCIAGFVKAEHDVFQLGSRSTEQGNDNATELTFDEFTPGMVVKLKPGESIETFSPTIRTTDTHTLCRQIMREIGLAIGLPLELTLLDHSDSSFSANRATLESYKRTARHQQRWLSRCLRSRVYRWKVRQWVAEGRLPDVPTIAEHVIHYPEWTFLDPIKEAQADAVRLDNHLASPRQVAAERGRDVDDVVKEIAEDRADLIRQAKAQADALAKEGIEGVTWRDLLGAKAGAAA
ncbi:MAG: phage portal protein [Planctomycetes bacterium]|nr:phage portal protein [Planctomycetota bacterium]